MTNATAIYEHHHSHHREDGFSILEKERGDLFKQWIGTGKRLLDIGCRDGALTSHFNEGNSVLGIDVDRSSLERARERYGIETRLVDVTEEWPFAKNEFDAIVAGEILEHLYFPDKVIANVRSSLKPNGIFIGSVPNAFSLKHRLRYLAGSTRYTPLSDPTHINQFTCKKFSDLLRKEFNNVEIVGLGRYSRLAKWNPSLFGFDLAFRAR